MKPDSCISYLKSYWFGQHSIRRTLLINFLLPTACVFIAQKLVLQPLVATNQLPAITVLVILFVVYLGLALTVCVALNRHQRIQSGGYATNGDVVFANAAVLVAFIYLLISLTDVLTGRTGEVTVNAERGLRINPSNENPTYSEVDAEKGIYSLSGTIGIGATSRFRAFLANLPTTSKKPANLILDSDGGNIFEARGLAKFVRSNNVTTHVDRQCLSACTLVFVSGNQRTADPQARFGFHAYRLDSKSAQVWLDSNEEQRKDMDIFRHSNVDPDFVSQIYQSAPDALWIPSHSELKAARFLYSGAQQ